MGIVSSSHKDRSAEDIANLEGFNLEGITFNESTYKNVVSKIRACSAYKKRDDAWIQRFARDLAYPEHMHRSYLNLDFLESLDLFKRLEQEIPFDAMQGSNNNNNNNNNNNYNNDGPRLLKMSPAASTSTDVEQMPSSAMDKLMDIDIKELQKEENKPEQRLNTKSIKIKLVVTESYDNSKFQRSIREVLSPFISNFSIMPQFGMFHTALLIGPWKIEWNDSGLVVPRKTVAKASVMCADIEELTALPQVEDVVKKLCVIVCDWNCNKTYTEIPRGGTSGNCQDFVDDVLARLGLKINFTGTLGEFIKHLRQKGKAEMAFMPTPDFISHFSLRVGSNKIVFDTHEQLDRFVAALVKVEPEMDKNPKYRGEWIMLKSFDRAFWMRHYRLQSEKEDTKFSPLRGTKEVEIEGCVTSQEVLLCPFKDPVATYSTIFLAPAART